ncbi:hypothetical protein [Myceligenerans indicum]|uniref:IrrE N-terminal-like domain-containing protein n=1 Tax=Myceligenerans indicum TaxID=2593663 RepID=A0ABS1LLR7_9MICO|nr:hypothetical protein [Myceligenerans indicum]MBL0886728.1 hypothetical protein [Myceligenerans indicum]
MEIIRKYGLDQVGSLDEACARVQELRGRPLSVVDGDLGPGLSGMWLGYGNRDRIVVSSVHAMTRLHRQHILAHELMHIVEALDDPAQERHEGRREGYDDPTEQRVELLASHLMMALARVGGAGDRLIALETYR